MALFQYMALLISFFKNIFYSFHWICRDISFFPMKNFLLFIIPVEFPSLHFRKNKGWLLYSIVMRCWNVLHMECIKIFALHIKIKSHMLWNRDLTICSKSTCLSYHHTQSWDIKSLFKTMTVIILHIIKLILRGNGVWQWL